MLSSLSVKACKTLAALAALNSVSLPRRPKPRFHFNQLASTKSEAIHAPIRMNAIHAGSWETGR